MRGLEFWKNFTYAVKFELHNPEKKETKVNFVTDVNYSNKTFEFRTLEEISKQNKKICRLNLEEAVDLMNSMVCNGYQNVSMQPYFE